MFDLPEGLVQSITDAMNDEKNPMEGLPFIVGKITNFTPSIKELKMFNNGKDIENEGARHLNNKIKDFKNTLEDPKFKLLFNVINYGFPIVPFPRAE